MGRQRAADSESRVMMAFRWPWHRGEREGGEKGKKKEAGDRGKGGEGQGVKPQSSKGLAISLGKRAARKTKAQDIEAQETGATTLKNPRHEAMAVAIAEGSTITDAYLLAGYKSKTRPQASVNASQMYRNVLIRGRVAYLQKAVAATAVVKAGRVIEELERIGYGALTDIVEWGPDGLTVTDSADLTPEQVAAVKSVKMVTRRDGTVEMQLTQHDKIKALQELAVIHKARPDKEAAGPSTVVIVAPAKRDAAEWVKTYGDAQVMKAPKSIEDK